MKDESTIDTMAVVTPNCAMASRSHTSSYRTLHRPETKKKPKYQPTARKGTRNLVVPARVERRVSCYSVLTACLRLKEFPAQRLVAQWGSLRSFNRSLSKPESGDRAVIQQRSRHCRSNRVIQGDRRS
jgi:hypothetical protein